MLFFLFIVAIQSYAQWQTTGNGIYYNAGNVSIGTSVVGDGQGSKLNVRTSPAAQGLLISNCDNSGAQTLLGLTTADQMRAGMSMESYFQLYNDAKWNFNSANSHGGSTLPISFSTDGTSRFYIKPNGSIGIGTSLPDNLLTLNGSLGFFRTGTYQTAMSTGFIKYNDTGMVIGNSSTGDPLRIQTNSADRIFISNDGNVGIGTTLLPDAKLTVKGTIHTNEVRVDLLGAVVPDYVFEETYKLPSLEELNSYIKVNRHLPEIPSACVIEENGVNLGEMDLLLLKKVEELTLYVIELKKENEALKKDMQSQQKEIDALKK